MALSGNLNIPFDKNYIHWFQLLIHAIPVFIAVAVVIGHYKWQKHSGKKTLILYAEQSNKLIFTMLQLLLFMTIYLSIDSFFTMRSIEHYTSHSKQTTDKILSKLDDADSEKNLFANGTDGIYEEVGKEFAKRTDYNSDLQIYILGYTLFSVEPKLKSWKESGYLRSVTITLFHLDENFIKKSPFIDQSWGLRAKTHINGIKNFISENKDYLEKNNVKINIYPYQHIPAVHGFKFGDDTYFASFSSWEENGKRIKMPNEDIFVRVDKNNETKQAKVYRKLFDNWLKHYNSINNVK